MPKHTLTDGFRNALTTKLVPMLGRVSRLTEQAMPFGPEEFQAMLMDPQPLASMRDLTARKIFVPTYTNIHVSFERVFWPALTHTAHVYFKVRKPVYAEADFSGSYRMFRARSCPEDIREALHDWLNNTIKANRLRQMAIETLTKSVNAFPTMAHLVANWPTLIEHIENPTWRDKASDILPRELARCYLPEGELLPKFKLRREATDVLITQSMFLEDGNYQGDWANVTMYDWKVA